MYKQTHTPTVVQGGGGGGGGVAGTPPLGFRWVKILWKGDTTNR